MALDFKMPVLVVEDYSTMLRIIRNFLRQLGFIDIDGATDGDAALEMMHEKNYGLVISDWNMAPMTGYQLLRQVRADGALSATPFIMVTGDADRQHEQAAAAAGVSNYLTKPFNAVTLRNRIETLFTD